MKKFNKVLLFPNYLGGGYGHIGRCLALADSLRRRGGQAYFTVNGPHVQSIVNAGYEANIVSTPPVAVSQRNGPAYVYVDSMAYQIVRDGFDNANMVLRAIEETGKIVERIKPQLLVGDGYPLTWLLGKKYGIPVVQLVKSVAHPQPERMVYWEDPPRDIILPDPRPVFNPVLEMLGLPPLNRAEQLLSGDLLIIPSIPVLDPMASLPDDTHYVGGIVQRRVMDASMPEWFKMLSHNKPVIYVSVGGAAGHGGSVTFFRKVFQAFKDSEWQVIVSTGGEVDLSCLEPVPSNMRVVNWVPGQEMIARSDLVVFHGGYTRVQILMQGRPSVIIPFHSEQEYYGRLMEKAGVARIVHYSDEPYHCYRRRWKGGNRWITSKQFTVHIRLNATLKPEILRTAVAECMRDSEMRIQARALGAELESHGGCDMIINMIRSRLS